MSTLIKNQLKTFTKEFTEDGTMFRITCNIRHDDSCGNGHNTFSITGDIEEFRYGKICEYSGGCIHEDITKHFPELQKFIKWHLMSTVEPMHYVSNTVYHASNRDYNGLLKGEIRQIKSGKTGLPAWHLMAIDKSTGVEFDLYAVENKSIDSLEKPNCNYTMEYRPWCRIGEGKERDFNAARSTAIWPDATDADLMSSPDELKEKLIARLPSLLNDFKKDVESLGFVF
jgi:hypothetical protein